MSRPPWRVLPSHTAVVSQLNSVHADRGANEADIIILRDPVEDVQIIYHINVLRSIRSERWMVVSVP